MKVSSPIGDLPFKPTNIKITHGSVLLEGNMGAWPARVEVKPSDILDIVYLMRFVFIGLLTAITTIAALIYIRK